MRRSKFRRAGTPATRDPRKTNSEGRRETRQLICTGGELITRTGGRIEHTPGSNPGNMA
jgi:hypothetical protein